VSFSSVPDVVTSSDKPGLLAFARHAARSKLQFEAKGGAGTGRVGGGEGAAGGKGAGTATMAGGVVHAAKPVPSTPKSANVAAVQRIDTLSPPRPILARMGHGLYCPFTSLALESIRDHLVL